MYEISIAVPVCLLARILSSWSGGIISDRMEAHTMKSRKLRRAEARLQSRIDSGEWPADEGMNRPGSRNPSKGARNSEGTFSKGNGSRARIRSRKAIGARA